MRTAMGGTLITYTSAVDLYDEYIRQYEINCIDWMNVQLGSNKPLGNQVPSVGTSDQSDGKSVWMIDPFSLLRNHDARRSALSTGAKATQEWLTKTLNMYVLYFLKELCDPDVTAIVTKKIQEAKATRATILWQTMKAFVRSLLQDPSPVLMLESIQTMTRPNEMIAA